MIEASALPCVVASDVVCALPARRSSKRGMKHEQHVCHYVRTTPTTKIKTRK